jgi:trimeric autotransporter adhesin
MPSNQLSHKPNHKRTLQLLAAFATLFPIALAVGCTGFFVNPTLTGVTVGPAATIQQGKQVQMTATGTYNDGSTKTITSGVFWSSDTMSVATIGSTSGLVTGVGPGTSSIAGASGTFSGSATVTVTLSGITKITVTSLDTSITYGAGENFTATATTPNGMFNVTDSVTWTTNPSSITNVSIDSTNGVLTTTSGGTGSTTFSVIATDPSTGIFGSKSFTVHQ